MVQRALEDKRGGKKDKTPDQIGSSQEANVTVTATGPTLELLKAQGEDNLASLFIVAKVTLVEGTPAEEAIASANVIPSEDQKCPRCWNFWIPAQSEQELCARCAGVVKLL